MEVYFGTFHVNSNNGVKPVSVAVDGSAGVSMRRRSPEEEAAEMPPLAPGGCCRADIAASGGAAVQCRMLLLNADNTSYDPATVEDFQTLRRTNHFFAVLDTAAPDFRCLPLMYVSRKAEPGLLLQVGEHHRIELPASYHLLLVEQWTGESELLPVAELSNAQYTAYGFSPLSGFMPICLPIRVVRPTPARTWITPSCRADHLLALPLGKAGDAKPVCIYGAPTDKASIDLSRLLL